MYSIDQTQHPIRLTLKSTDSTSCLVGVESSLLNDIINIFRSRDVKIETQAEPSYHALVGVDVDCVGEGSCACFLDIQTAADYRQVNTNFRQWLEALHAYC